MNFMSAMEIAASGLNANRVRMNLAASNLANANTTRGADGGPYRRRDPIFSSTNVGGFKNALGGALHGVRVSGVAVDQRAPRTVHDPGHPDADDNGFIRLPNVNMVEEMVNLITASRSYEAGVSTLQTIKTMAHKALSIGR